MLRSRIVLRALAITGLLLSTIDVHAEPGGSPARAIGIAIEDFVYVDTSGESVDQVEAHRKQLAAFMSALRRDFAGDERYRVVALTCGSPCVDAEESVLLRATADAGARIALIGGIHKMSTLVQWAKVAAIDVEGQRVLLDKLFTFRGDNARAWERAEVFVSREIRAGLAVRQAGVSAATPEPIKLAVFDFELEDFSAGSSSNGVGASDEARLAGVTKDVRELLAQSGRYRLVDVISADAAAAKTHTLHACDGCEAPVALRLGADQSLVGVVSRISRTEYTLRFELRDARTGSVVSHADSGLRMGADYSWGRGATQLIRDGLLDKVERSTATAAFPNP